METNLRPIFCSVEDFFFSKGRVRLVDQLLLNLKFNLWDNNAGRVLFRKPSVCVWLSKFCNHNKYISVSFQVIQILINGFMDSNFQVAYISSKMKRYPLKESFSETKSMFFRKQILKCQKNWNFDTEFLPIGALVVLKKLERCSAAPVRTSVSLKWSL